ncbi:MAG: four helix bundle protein [Bacteroidota bacterium]|nr:four helix bundle protein [Bacteroidota bacterium]
MQFCRQARGSLYELMDHLIISFDEKYITLTELKKLQSEVLNVVKILNGYIGYLKNQKKQS